MPELQILPRGTAPSLPPQPFESRSYSGAWMGCARSDAPLGVDLASEPAPHGFAAVIAEFYHPAERDAFAGLPEADRARAFLASWVLKEAWCKAESTGLAGLPGPDLSAWIARGCAAESWDQQGYRFTYRRDAGTQFLHCGMVSAMRVAPGHAIG